MRRELTFVDAIVAAFVVVVSAAMLFSGCLSAKGPSHRTQCMNNQKQIAAAALGFEYRKGRFPGYKEKVAGHDVSWAVMLLPCLDRRDLWEQWQAKPYGSQAQVRLNQMICVSDPPDSRSPTDGSSSYAINTLICGDGSGLAEMGIKDGAAVTLLLSENLKKEKRHTWWDLDPNTIGFSKGAMKDNIQSNHGEGVNQRFSGPC